MRAHNYFDETGIFTVVEAFSKVLKRGIAIMVNKMIRISEWLKKNLGSFWFTGRTLFYLLFRGFYHNGIRKDRNNVACK